MLIQYTIRTDDRHIYIHVNADDEKAAFAEAIRWAKQQTWFPSMLQGIDVVGHPNFRDSEGNMPKFELDRLVSNPDVVLTIPSNHDRYPE